MNNQQRVPNTSNPYSPLGLLEMSLGGLTKPNEHVFCVPAETIVVNAKTGGAKGAKSARFDLIPPEALRTIAEVYGHGCTKYAPRNWERGYGWSYSYAALQRHLNAYWGGEYLDPESGLPHLAHAAWHCLTLMEFNSRFPELDDRKEPLDVS